MKPFRNNRPTNTSLSFEEKNPTLYIYKSSGEIKKLKEVTERAKRTLSDC